MESLAGMTLTEIRAEPGRLNSSREDLSDDIQALNLSNYRIHVENHHAGKNVRTGLQSLKCTLDGLPDKADALGAAAKGFASTASKLTDQQRSIRLTLQHHTQLLELLEIPQLMETCVRNGLFEEALDLAEFVKTLAVRHKLDDDPNPTGANLILHDIVSDARETLRYMREHLLAQLKAKANLPTCLRIVNHLRRLYGLHQLVDRDTDGDMMTDVEGGGKGGGGPEDMESRLRTEFLECRNQWHTREVEAAAGTSSSQVLKVIEIQRAQWADIVRQYRALFRPASSTPVAISPTSAGASGALSPASHQSGASSTAASSGAEQVDLLLHSWITHRIEWFLALLTRAMSTMTDGAAISSVLDQSMYLASRCGRFGADFRALLVPLFENHVYSLAKVQLEAASATFRATVSGWTWAYHVGLTYDDGEAGDGSAGSGAGGLGSTSPSAATVSDDDLTPPRVLLSVLPLAELVNGVLGTLNCLRQCVLVSAVPVVVSAYKALVSNAKAAMSTAKHADRTKARSAAGPGANDDETATRRYEALCKSFETVAIPYLDRCMTSLVRVPVQAARPVPSSSSAPSRRSTTPSLPSSTASTTPASLDAPPALPCTPADTADPPPPTAAQPPTPTPTPSPEPHKEEEKE